MADNKKKNTWWGSAGLPWGIPTWQYTPEFQEFKDAFWNTLRGNTAQPAAATKTPRSDIGWTQYLHGIALLIEGGYISEDEFPAIELKVRQEGLHEGLPYFNDVVNTVQQEEAASMGKRQAGIINEQQEAESVWKRKLASEMTKQNRNIALGQPEVVNPPVSPYGEEIPGAANAFGRYGGVYSTGTRGGWTPPVTEAWQTPASEVPTAMYRSFNPESIVAETQRQAQNVRILNEMRDIERRFPKELRTLIESSTAPWAGGRWWEGSETKGALGVGEPKRDVLAPWVAQQPKYKELRQQATLQDISAFGMPIWNMYQQGKNTDWLYGDETIGEWFARSPEAQFTLQLQKTREREEKERRTRDEELQHRLPRWTPLRQRM